MDFTLKKYEELCNALKTRKIYTVESYLQEKPINNFAILRHDVDRSLDNALQMARLENKMSIKSTYYFRINNNFNKNIPYAISKLGHEIGYHYEVMSKCKGNSEKAINLFKKELTTLRKFCEVNTISMHGSPLSKYNNLELWDHYDYHSFDILGDASLSIKNVYYLTDTGRSWSSENNIRDFIKDQLKLNVSILNTNELITYLKENKEKFYLTIHPERWPSSYIGYMNSFITDIVFNTGKIIIKRFNDNENIH